MQITIERTLREHVLNPSRRACEVTCMFGLSDVDEPREVTLIPRITIPLPSPGVVFITGPSGGGKSTMLELIAEAVAEHDPPHAVINVNEDTFDDQPLLDQFDAPLDRTLALLSAAGLAEAYIMLRSPLELSEGQRARFTLARALHRADKASGPAVILADEFAATLDRLSAHALARTMRRWIGRTGHTLVAATTHDDLLESLQPDVLIEIDGTGTVHVLLPAANRKIDMFDPDHIKIEPGSVRDYDALARFHYRAARPATIDRIYRAVMPARTVSSRFLSRNENDLLLGVLIVSHAHLSCAMRNVALSGRYLGLDRKHAARLVNEEVRTISRVIVDPRCRGVGLAVRLVRHALVDATTPYTEAIAAMGNVHPFFEKAGMMRFDPPVSREMSRFEAALAQIECPAWTLASTREVSARIDLLKQDRRDWFHAELRRFARTRGRGDQRQQSSLPFNETLRLARTRLWSQPIYYIHHSQNHAENR